ncbi:MAG: bifunctional DNA-formamidopyrimidine glycosylase/DNA-(apurinic or apyrimidinic site) lyase [Nitrospinae bacterium]|nr:bifunctional DNA-formamidopyrimidine glycosylase/DNA-(apurinic or apyrimidinic site) lyase [Nitrospinota bacterium]
MPELVEVQTIVDSLRGAIVGRRIADIRVRTPLVVQGQPVALRKGLRGRIVLEVTRRGKYILARLTHDHTLVIDLRMTGQVQWSPPQEPPDKHTHLLITWEGLPEQLRYRDVRKFGRLRLLPTASLAQAPPLARLGPDALGISLAAFEARLAGKRRGIKSALLDQGVLAGLGTIYTDESLFRAKLHPARATASLSSLERRALHQAVQEVLCEGLMYGGSSIDTYRHPDGTKGTFQTRHRVFQRKGLPCVRCGTVIIRVVMGGRGTHLCPRCQRP